MDIELVHAVFMKYYHRSSHNALSSQKGFEILHSISIVSPLQLHG